ncbi:unnamed protein product [Rhizoctonia solani]|uniref:Uncharacterized protein n=1 Tax=Rhizoctonia solani TaxID=456999 RepID=A0A8H3BNN1_9AGAM|nr:unnamed protein product [Rhizoctonia solani]
MTSIALNDPLVGDWEYYYVNRFANRDMFMRYFGPVIAHIVGDTDNTESYLEYEYSELDNGASPVGVSDEPLHINDRNAERNSGNGDFNDEDESEHDMEDNTFLIQESPDMRATGNQVGDMCINNKEIAPFK